MRNPVGALGGAARSRAVGTRDVRAWLRRAAAVVRTVMGAPDYERYVAHVRDHHPECDVLSRDEFMRQRLESRYSKPGSRCC